MATVYERFSAALDALEAAVALSQAILEGPENETVELPDGEHINTIRESLRQLREATEDGPVVSVNDRGGHVTIDGDEVATLYEGVDDVNRYTDAEKSKLAGLDSSKFLGAFEDLSSLQAAYPDPGGPGFYADVDAGPGNDVERYIWDVDDGAYVLQLGESTAETAASVKTKYESNPDTNAYTNAEKSKLAGVESGATADQSAAEIRDAYEGLADVNRFSDEDKEALDSALQPGANVSELTNDAGYLTTTPFRQTVACSDEETALETGTAKITFRMTAAVTLSAVRASLTTAQTSGSILTIDINKNGSTILSTKLTIDNGERTSLTAATAAVLSTTSLAADDEVTIDIDGLGDGTAAGLKVSLIGVYT